MTALYERCSLSLKLLEQRRMLRSRHPRSGFEEDSPRTRASHYAPQRRGNSGAFRFFLKPARIAEASITIVPGHRPTISSGGATVAALSLAARRPPRARSVKRSRSGSSWGPSDPHAGAGQQLSASTADAIDFFWREAISRNPRACFGASIAQSLWLAYGLLTVCRSDAFRACRASFRASRVRPCGYHFSFGGHGRFP